MEDAQHPEDVNPLGMHHEPRPAEERRQLRALAVSLVAVLVLVPIIAAISYSPTVNVFVGLLPLIATIILDIIITLQHFKKVMYWINLIVVHLVSLAVLYLLNLLLAVPINVPGAVSVSMMIAILVTLVVWVLDGKGVLPERPAKAHAVEFRPEKLDEYVQSIEDKVKAINFAIGRVYRASNGGNAGMRERLRILREWYNEFYQLKEEELDKEHAGKVKRAKILLHKINDRLKILSKKEKDVFSEKELSRLKNLARNPRGEDTVLEVLKKNDNDPVEHYYVSAIDFCDRIIEELEKIA